MGEIVSLMEVRARKEAAPQKHGFNPGENDFYIVFGRESGGLDNINDLFENHKFIIDVAADWLQGQSKFIIFSLVTQGRDTAFTGYPLDDALDLHNIIKDIAFNVPDMRNVSLDFFGVEEDLCIVLAAQWRGWGGRHCATSS